MKIKDPNQEPLDKCSCCNKPWTKHPGIIPTCSENQELKELLRECAEVLRELYDEMVDWGETPHTKPMSKAATLLTKLEEGK